MPFTERFFDLCLPARAGTAEQHHGPAGFVGMITANSFMKREFGKKLIEDYLPTKALTHVIDTSGAYIPGHGTPTVILFARNQRPQDEPIRAVLGIRGEPGTPEDAAQGLVWRSIVDLLERPGSENAYVSVVDQERGTVCAASLECRRRRRDRAEGADRVGRRDSDAWLQSRRPSIGLRASDHSVKTSFILGQRS